MFAFHRHQKTVLSPGLTVRFANLPNNALLELIELENGATAINSNVTICVQAEDGSRYTQEFASSGKHNIVNVLERLFSYTAVMYFSNFSNADDENWFS